jgi:hypothetical protein
LIAEVTAAANKPFDLLRAPPGLDEVNARMLKADASLLEFVQRQFTATTMLLFRAPQLTHGEHRLPVRRLGSGASLIVPPHRPGVFLPPGEGGTDEGGYLDQTLF